LLDTNRSTDRDEREAERMENTVGRLPGPERRSDVESTSSTTVRSGSATGGLDDRTRVEMEAAFGDDFGDVRVHTDARAARVTRLLNARALTVGRNVLFSRGEYHPWTSAGRGLLAHELTHVVQQRRRASDVRVMPKIKLTGDPAHIRRTIAILNAGLFGYTVGEDSSGNLTITRNGIQGPPTPEQQALYTRLNRVISSSREVAIAVGSGTRPIVGNYALEAIDIADIEAMGTGPDGFAVGYLIHEIEEQYQKQVRGVGYGGETTGAHAEGIRAESEVMGATRGPQRNISASRNPDGSLNAVLEVPYTFPDGRVVTLVVTIRNNDVVSVRRR
jgi:hypothetical protein